MFIQKHSSLFSGVAFWAPDDETSRWHWGVKAGAWLLKDLGESPAFTPFVEFAPHVDLIWPGFSIGPVFGVGYSFVVDMAQEEIGAMIQKEWIQGPWGLSGFGVQYSIFNATIKTEVIIGSLLWRW